MKREVRCLSRGFVRGFCPGVLSGVFVRGFCPGFLSGGFVRGFCQGVVSGGFVRGILVRVGCLRRVCLRKFSLEEFVQGVLSGRFCPGGFVRGVLSGDFVRDCGGFNRGFCTIFVGGGGALSEDFPGGVLSTCILSAGVLSGGDLSGSVLSVDDLSRGVLSGGVLSGVFCWSLVRKTDIDTRESGCETYFSILGCD